MASMPKVKARLTDQGVSFSNYIINVSLCCPSRATMLRGQYAHNTGVLTNSGAHAGFQTAYARGIEKSTFATWLQEAGYRTAFYGKYLNFYPNSAPPAYVPPGWNDWASPTGGTRTGSSTICSTRTAARCGAGPRRRTTAPTSTPPRPPISFERPRPRAPFLIYLSVYAPDFPATPAPRHAALFEHARAPRTRAFNEEDVSDKPAFIRNRPQIMPRGQEAIDGFYRNRLRSLQAVDEAVDMLLNVLEGAGQLDRTFVVFASDNGFHMGHHRLQFGKQTPYEEDIRVPLIVRGPGVPAGRTAPHLAGNIDLAPTFAEMAGAAAPAFVDGRSLVPLLGRTPPPANDFRSAYLIGHWAELGGGESPEPGDADQAGEQEGRGRRGRAGGRQGARGGGRLREALIMPPFQGVRTMQYTYVKYESGERELYEVNKDPDQLNNIASKASGALLQSLAGQLAKLKTCAGASCR